jgi:hypothetical protein
MWFDKPTLKDKRVKTALLHCSLVLAVVTL